MKLRCSLEFVVLVFGLSFSAQATTTRLESIPIPGTRAFPERITSKSDGTLYVGRLGDGGIGRINPHTHGNTIFVQPRALGSPATGSDTGSALKAFDLRTGIGKRSVSLPGAHAFCNDIAVDTKGSIFVTDRAKPIILKISPGASCFRRFAHE